MTDRAAELDQMTDHQAIISLEGEFPGWMVWREGLGRWLNSCFARSHATDAGVSGEDWADLRDQIIRATAEQPRAEHAERQHDSLSPAVIRTNGPFTARVMPGRRRAPHCPVRHRLDRPRAA